MSQVDVCAQFTVTKGKSVESKSIHLEGEKVYLVLDGTIIGSSLLEAANENQTLSQQLSLIVKDFDTAKVCRGVPDSKFASIKLCAGAVYETTSFSTWRSVTCKKIFSADKGGESRSCCPDCYVTKRALGRLASRTLPPTPEEKLASLRAQYKLAKSKLDRKDEKLLVIYNINLSRIFFFLILFIYLKYRISNNR